MKEIYFPVVDPVADWKHIAETLLRQFKKQEKIFDGSYAA